LHRLDVQYAVVTELRVCCVLQVGKAATEAKAELEAQLPSSMRIFLVPQVRCCWVRQGQERGGAGLACSECPPLCKRACACPLPVHAAARCHFLGWRAAGIPPQHLCAPANLMPLPTHMPLPPSFLCPCLPPSSLLQGSLMTMDFRTDRIRIIYNQETGLVTSPPRIG